MSCEGSSSYGTPSKGLWKLFCNFFYIEGLLIVAIIGGILWLFCYGNPVKGLPVMEAFEMAYFYRTPSKGLWKVFLL